MRWMAILGLSLGLAEYVPAQFNEDADNRLTFGGPVNDALGDGVTAILNGDYDSGIAHTLRGLQDQSLTTRQRSQALSNLCGAYAAKRMAEAAIRSCTESLTLDDGNWRAYSNRSYAYWIAARYPEAHSDLESASAINPRARQIAMIRGMLNERQLRPSVVMEDLQ